jgi:hypothetical protein
MLPVIILYIDKQYQVTYWIIQNRVKIFSQITIPQAIQLLKSLEFDLIVSDPQHIAILKPSTSLNTRAEEGNPALPSIPFPANALEGT